MPLAQAPEGERYFGLENFGNTCYANSVLQTLYFCQPFRDAVLTYADSLASLSQPPEESLLTCLAELFLQVSCQALCKLLPDISSCLLSL